MRSRFICNDDGQQIMLYRFVLALRLQLMGKVENNHLIEVLDTV